MQPFNCSIEDVIQKRYSCRTYRPEQIASEDIQQLYTFIDSIKTGPLGCPVRYRLISATDQDRKALRGLGTYGTIRNPAGFITGAAGPGEKNLEDFGYQMEAIILSATNLGLGTCWIGGFFTRSTFARKMDLAKEEIIPAVTAIGYPSEESRSTDLFRAMSRGTTRLSWKQLFFKNDFNTPLSEEEAGPYSFALEMLRLGPSASNRQPWRVVKSGDCFHFYLQRTPGYGKGTLVFRLGSIADLQRVDIGIAMCHFEFGASEQGLRGKWQITPPTFNPSAEYIASWIPSE